MLANIKINYDDGSMGMGQIDLRGTVGAAVENLQNHLNDHRWVRLPIIVPGKNITRWTLIDTDRVRTIEVWASPNQPEETP